jgi:GNAT superfamily N-acetyltransferase
MLLTRDDGYLLTDGKARLDVELIHRWLSEDAYWALGIEFSRVQASIAASDCYGIHDPDQALVGITRVVTDGVTFGWLTDVYITPDHRGRGLGSWMVDQIRQVYAATGMRRLVLVTSDAHGVCQKAGFEPLAAPSRWMEAVFVPLR